MESKLEQDLTFNINVNYSQGFLTLIDEKIEIIKKYHNEFNQKIEQGELKIFKYTLTKDILSMEIVNNNVIFNFCTSYSGNLKFEKGFKGFIEFLVEVRNNVFGIYNFFNNLDYQEKSHITNTTNNINVLGLDIVFHTFLYSDLGEKLSNIINEDIKFEKNLKGFLDFLKTAKNNITTLYLCFNGLDIQRDSKQHSLETLSLFEVFNIFISSQKGENIKNIFNLQKPQESNDKEANNHIETMEQFIEKISDKNMVVKYNKLNIFSSLDKYKKSIYELEDLLSFLLYYKEHIDKLIEEDFAKIYFVSKPFNEFGFTSNRNDDLGKLEITFYSKKPGYSFLIFIGIIQTEIKRLKNILFVLENPPKVKKEEEKTYESGVKNENEAKKVKKVKVEDKINYEEFKTLLSVVFNQ